MDVACAFWYCIGIVIVCYASMVLPLVHHWYCLLCGNFSDSSSDCSISSLWPPNSTGTRDIANASCCRGNSSPSSSSADSSSSSDSITNETSIAGKRPKRYYWLQILPNKCVKVQLDRLELLAMLDRYCPVGIISQREQSVSACLIFNTCLWFCGCAA